MSTILFPRKGDRLRAHSVFFQAVRVAASGIGVISGMAPTRLSASAVAVAAGTYRHGNASHSYAGGSITAIPAATATYHRHDLIVFDVSDDTPKRIAGIEDIPNPVTDFLELATPQPPELDSVSQILLAIILVDSSGVVNETHGHYCSSGIANMIIELPSPKLDDMGDPDNNTDLNVSVTKHGLCPIAPNSALQVLLGTGLFGVPDHGGLGGLGDDDHTQYIKHSLATAINDFLVASGSGAYVKKTLAEVKTILGLGSAAYTASTAYVPHSLATAINDFLVASGSGAYVKKTLAEVKTILGLGSAAYTASGDYAVAAKGVTGGDGHDHVGGDGAQIDHGGLGGLGDDDHTQYIKHSLATAINDFLVAPGAGSFVKKTLAEVKTILGLGSAAYTASGDYAVAAKGVTGGDGHDHVGGDGAQVDHGGLGGLGDDDHGQYHTDGRGDVRYAPIAKGVTGGDAHNHVGGDGAQVDHGGLGGLGDDDHTQYIKHSLATAINDFLVAPGAGSFVKKTLAEVKTILGLGSAAYTASTAYVPHSLATAINDFLVASGSGAYVKKTLAEVKTILGLGSAAYTASGDYAVAAKGVTGGDAHNHVGGDGAQVDHGGLGGLGDDDHGQYHTDGRGDARYAPIAKGVTGGDSHNALHASAFAPLITRTFEVAFPFGDGGAVLQAGICEFRLPINCKIVAARIQEATLISSSVICTLYKHAGGAAEGSPLDSFALSGSAYMYELGLNIAVSVDEWVRIKTSGITAAKQITCSLVFEAT
ncbi:MAG: hypothetical protein ACYDG4_15145 [Desulfuromonadaceae bacterium]